MDREQLYARLPWPLQNLAICYEGWRIARSRFEGEFERFVAEYESRSCWPVERIVAFRDQRLAAFVQHAATTTPYYRDLFAKRRLDPAAIRTLDDLRQLPVLQKSEVQDQRDRFRSEAVDPATTVTVHTSGSTGAGLQFPVTKTGSREHWAVYYRYCRWHGLDTRREWCLQFGGRSIVPAEQQRPPFWRWNYPGRQLMFSAYHLSATTAPAYLAAMQKSGAAWMHGYPSFVSLVAGYALELGVSLPIRWVTLGSESVLPQQVELIERAFGVRPVQHYAMTESVANISQCPQGKLHVDEDFCGVEFDPRGDDSFAVLGTNLINPAFPLLRYEVGDHVTVGAESCDCGRPGRVVAAIDGRREDYIVTARGARIGRLDHIFKDMIHVREAQLVQQAPGQMTIRIVKGPQFAPEDERQLVAEIRKRIRDVEFQIEYVPTLPRTSRGKLRFVVSTIAADNKR